jgi:hypothetical protein
MPINPVLPAEIVADMIESFTEFAIQGLATNPQKVYHAVIENVEFFDFFVLYKILAGKKTLTMPGEHFNECMQIRCEPFKGCVFIIESEPAVIYRPKRVPYWFNNN